MEETIELGSQTKHKDLLSDKNQILKSFEAQKVNKIKVMVFDIDGILRSKYISLKKLTKHCYMRLMVFLRRD